LRDRPLLRAPDLFALLHCPGPEPPPVFSAVKHPARPCKTRRGESCDAETPSALNRPRAGGRARTGDLGRHGEERRHRLLQGRHANALTLLLLLAAHPGPGPDLGC
jgi:hypothetical protein